MTGVRLAPAVRLYVEYSDANEFGSPASTKLIDNLREVMADLRGKIRAMDPSEVGVRGASLLQEFRNSERFRNLLDPGGRLADRVLYPDPALCKPTALQFTHVDTGAGFRFEVDSAEWPAVHEFIAQLAGDECLPGDPVPGTLFAQLAVRGMLVKADSSPISYQATARSEWSSCDITWLGHNTAVVRSGKAAVIVDPWLLPGSNRYPETFQPAQRGELGGIDALIITHSHPDHFDPATLLQFRCDTPVIVPRVHRESLLSVEMKTRLLELGFSDVRELDWWESAWIADIEVVALPFYGEQPTSGEQLIPEVRNSGNAYLIRTPGVSCAFVADCGRDSRGDVRDVALEAYRRFGSVDFLFSGYRGWRIYPIQLVESSVPAYALFVPPDLYAVRQSIMNDAAEAVDTAEHWHARYLVPYADGGAPWFWEMGLGPILDRSEGQAREWIHFDPMPERVLDKLRTRSAPTANTTAPSPVHGMVMRPGESVSMLDGHPRILKAIHHMWPWNEATIVTAGGR